MDENEELSSNSTLYNRMVGHLGDFVAKIRDEEEKDSKSLYKTIEKVDQRYINEIPLAKGGMKEILRVEDLMTGRAVAKAVIKNLKSAESVEQFIQEARITAILEHPNIMPVYDIGIDDCGQAFFTMKLVEGDNLGDILKNLKKKNKKYEEAYPLARLLEIFIKVCDAVSYAHSKGVLHLDLKPDNIQVGDFGEVLVCDWGLSRFKPELKSENAEPIQYLEGQLTLHGQVFGSPGFMSPEQVTCGREELDHRSDIYSLGCILYSILTLKPAYKGTTVDELLDMTAEGKFKPPSKVSKGRFVPTALEAVCMHSMQYERENRYDNANELKEEVTAFINGYATFAERAGLITQFMLFCRRHRGLVILATLLIASSITFGIVYFNKQKETKEVVEALDQKEKETEQVSREKEQVTKEKEQLEIDAILRSKQNLLRFADLNFQWALNSLKDRNFREAADYFSRASDKQLKVYVDACNELVGNYDDTRLPAEKFMNLIKLLSKDLYTAVIEELLRLESKFLDHNEKVSMSREILLFMNPELEKLNYDVYQILGKTYITISKNLKLRYISALSLFNSHVIDLSETGIIEIEALRNMPLVNLDLRKTMVEDLEPVKSAPLETLNISHTKVKDVSLLSTEYLKNLHISGLTLDMDQLNSFKSLEKVSVSSDKKYEGLKFPFELQVLKIK